jgi:diadenosine tetraphosphate (Ap4A) HIT family hydrolase
MNHFELHSQLLADCHRVGRLDLCHILLHKNAGVPWFILVPETEARDLFDLAENLRAAALNEAALIAGLVKNVLHYPKINFAAIGNVVAQLHLHVVGRKPDDTCWPKPVWGHLTAGREYCAEELAEISSLLMRHCGMKLLE